MKTSTNLTKLHRNVGVQIAALALAVAGLCLLPAFLFAQGTGRINPTSRNPQNYRIGTSTEYDGFTTPKFDIMVAATEIGRLEQVNVAIGDRVKRGDIIAKLEDGLQHEAVATARWRAQMRGETDAAKAETALKLLRLEQLRTLADRDIARPDELKRAIADWEIAKARELASLEQDELRKLELSRYELQLNRRKVLAPMDGVVAELFHHPGEYITPADPAVIRLVVLDQLYGVFNIPVEEMHLIQIGDAVSINIRGIKAEIPGEVALVSPDIDGESGTVKVKVLIDNRDGQLRSGDRCRMIPRKSSESTPIRTSARTPVVRKVQRIGVSSQRGVSGIR